MFRSTHPFYADDSTLLLLLPSQRRNNNASQRPSLLLGWTFHWSSFDLWSFVVHHQLQFRGTWTYHLCLLILGAGKGSQRQCWCLHISLKIFKPNQLTLWGFCYLSVVINSLSEQRAYSAVKQRDSCVNLFGWEPGNITESLRSWQQYRGEFIDVRGVCWKPAINGKRRAQDKNKMCVLLGFANTKTCIYSAVIPSQPGLNSRCPNQCSCILNVEPATLVSCGDMLHS